MTNPKIEKVKANITKTKAAIADQQNKLKDLEKQKVQLENEEIIALFRREKLNEDAFAQLLRSSGKDAPVGGEDQDIVDGGPINEAEMEDDTDDCA